MSAASIAVLVASTASDLALGTALLFRGGRSPIRFGRFALAALAVGAFLLAKMLVVLASGRGFFAIHLAYVDTMIALPLFGVALLVAARRREVSFAVRALAAASLLLVPTGVYATFVEPKRLVEETATIPVDAARAGNAPITIGVLSDIQCTHVTDHEREAVARVLARRPDLILLPGDLVQVPFERFDALIPEFRALLAPLEAPLGVWFVLGNVDQGAQIERLIAGTRVELLSNRIVALDHGDRRIVLGGVDLAFDSPRAREVLRRLEDDPGDDVRLLVAHVPDVAYALRVPSRVDLVVAGHTHGGQVVVPFFGPPITLSSVPREVAAGGLHELGGTRIYVSRGVGAERGHAPLVRFLCRPEVSFLTLAAER